MAYMYKEIFHNSKNNLIYIALTGQNTAESNSAAIAEEVLERTAGHKVMGLVWEAFITVWEKFSDFFYFKKWQEKMPHYENTPRDKWPQIPEDKSPWNWLTHEVYSLFQICSTTIKKGAYKTK